MFHKVRYWDPYCLFCISIHLTIQLFTLYFADDVTGCACIGYVVSHASDCQLLQEDLARVFDWTVTRKVRLNPAKCEALNLSNKHSSLDESTKVYPAASMQSRYNLFMDDLKNKQTHQENLSGGK